MKNKMNKKHVLMGLIGLIVLVSSVSAGKVYFLSPGGYSIGYSAVEGNIISYTDNHVGLHVGMQKDEIFFDVPVAGTYDIVVRTDWDDSMSEDFKFCGLNEAGTSTGCVAGVKETNEDGTRTYTFTDVETYTHALRATPGSKWIFDGGDETYFYDTWLRLDAEGDRAELYLNNNNTMTLRTLSGYGGDEYSIIIHYVCGDNSGAEYFYEATGYEQDITITPCDIDTSCDIYLSYYRNVSSSNPMTWDADHYVTTLTTTKKVDVLMNPMAGIYTSPQLNNLGEPIILREYGNQSFTVQPHGQAYESINWTLRKYQDETILKRMSGVNFELWGNEVEAGGTYLLEAEILNACGTDYLARKTFYIFVPCEFSTVEGTVTRYNETDTWPVTNGTIEIGLLYNSSFDDAGHYKIEDVSEGCYGVKVYDYDIEGVDRPAETLSSECINQPTNLSLEIPTGFDSTYNLTVCFFDETNNETLGSGRHISLYLRDDTNSFIETKFTNSSGCVVFSGLFFGECDYVRWSEWEDYTPVNQRVCINRDADKKITINVSETTITEARFYITRLRDNVLVPLKGAQITCEGITGVTDETGEALLNLGYGENYNCSIRKEFYQTKNVTINNVPRDAQYTFTLTPVMELYSLGVYGFEIRNNTAGDYVPLKNIKFTIMEYGGGYEKTYLLDATNMVIELPEGLYTVTASKSGYMFDEKESTTLFNSESLDTGIRLYFSRGSSLVEFWDLFTVDILNVKDEESFRGVLWKILPPLFIFLVVALGLSVITDRFKRIKDDVGM